MMQLQRNMQKGEKKGTLRTGKVFGRRGKEEEEVQRLWGMLYADDAGIVSRLSEGCERMMTVILTVCSAFGLTVSEAKTDIYILCVRKPKAGRCRHNQCSRPGIQTRATLHRSLGLRGGNCAGRRLDSTTKEEGDWPSTGGEETD